MREMDVKGRNRMERGTKGEEQEMEGGRHLREHKSHELIRTIE